MISSENTIKCLSILPFWFKFTRVIIFLMIRIEKNKDFFVMRDNILLIIDTKDVNICCYLHNIDVRPHVLIYYLPYSSWKIAAKNFDFMTTWIDKAVETTWDSCYRTLCFSLG